MTEILTGPPIKSNRVDSKIRRKIVIEALLKAQKTATPPLLLLERAGTNWLNGLCRQEVITTLKEILDKDRNLFVIISRNYFQDASDYEKSVFNRLYSEKLRQEPWQSASEDDLVVLGVSGSFDNWCAAQNHQRNISLENLSERSRLKLLNLVESIHATFELTSNPKILIRCVPTDPNRDFEATRLALEFLRNKDVFISVNKFREGSVSVNVQIDVTKFLRVRDELLALYAPKTNSDTAPLKLSKSNQLNKFPKIDMLAWRDIIMRFVDGHTLAITAKETKLTASFWQMGFADARTREPNLQWHLLKLLAREGGQINWKTSAASNNIKKRKQVLSDTLRTYFHIDDDPFHPYQDNSSYRTKFTLKAEGD